MIHETELQIRLRNAKEALSSAAEKEIEALRSLRSAEESRRLAKEKYEALFEKEDQAELARRKALYNHCAL